MGVDMASFVEVKEKGTWTLFQERLFKRNQYEIDISAGAEIQPFRSRNYAFFGWLADIRNYSAVAPLDKPRGLPKNLSAALLDKYNGRAYELSFTNFSLTELLGVDYDNIVEDRRAMIDGNGAATIEAGKGEMMPLKDFLGEDIMESLEILKSRFSGYNLDDVRVIFVFC
jgi:hypothetical protein